MNENGDKRKPTESAISQERRKLLKGAAATAPVIATLHSGSVLANASAYQCINDASRNGNWPNEVSASTDNWVRRTVRRFQFKKRGTNVVSDWWYDVDNVLPANPPFSGTYTLYAVVGGTATPGSFDFDNEWEQTPVAQQTVNVLVYYSPNAAGTSVSEAGVYPKAYVVPYNDPPIPLNASCLASMNNSGGP